MEATSAPGLPATQDQETALALPQGLPMSAPPTDDGEGEGLSITGLVHSLRRQLLVGALAGIGVATLLAVVLWFMIPTQYLAQAVLRVEREATKGTPGDFMIYKETQAKLLKSNFVVTAALRPNDVNQLPIVREDDWGRARKHPVAWLSGKLSVNTADDELMLVNLSGRDKKQTEQLLDAVVTAYEKEIVNAERVKKVNELNGKRRNKRMLADSIMKHTEQVSTTAKAIGATTDTQIAQEQQLRIGRMHEARRELEALQRAYEDAVDALRMLQVQAQMGQGGAPDPNLIADEMSKDPQYHQLAVELDQMQDYLEQSSAQVNPNSPQLEKIGQEIGRLKRKQKEMEQRLRPRIIARIRRQSGRSPAELRMEIALAQQRTRSLQGRIERAQQKFLAAEEKLKDYVGTSGELEGLRSELLAMQTEMKTISQDMYALESVIASPPRVSVVEKANVPKDSNLIAKLTQVVGGWVVALFGVIGLVSYWDFLTKKVNTPEDISKAGRVIGTLPAIQQNGMFGRKERSEVEAAMKVAIDGVRTALIYNRQVPTQTVMVTSATGQEGRSTVASQLAVSMARAGKTTLLIDADLHNPQQQAIFGVQAAGGLSEMLRGEMTADEAIVATPVENVWLLSAGRCDQTALQGLAGEQARAVFEDLKVRFDSIIIDASPVLTGAEPLLLGQNADSAILSVRRDVSQLPKVTAASSRLASVGIPMLGSVLNGSSIEMRGGDVKQVETAAPAEAEEEPAALPTA